MSSAARRAAGRLSGMNERLAVVCYHRGGCCYHPAMRQLIARIDDDLHAEIKRRATEEGRSVNALVSDILAAAVAGRDRSASLRMRARASGRLVVPPRPPRVPSGQAVVRATRGAGQAVSEALAAERGTR